MIDNSLSLINLNQKKDNSVEISVIMSCYKEPLNWLKDSIDSIINQTFKNFEFILINDNPDDEQLSLMLETYSKKYKQIKLLRNSKNLGLIYSLNRGLDAANCKYIARMDADDIAFTNRLQIQFDYLEQNPECYLIGTGAVIIDEQNKKIDKFYPICSFEKIKKNIVQKNCFYHSTIMFRAENNIRYRDKMIYVEDYDLYLNLITQNKILRNIPECLCNYRVSRNSISSSRVGYQILFFNKAVEFYIERIKTGKDSYSDFNTQEILTIDIDNSKDKSIMIGKIHKSFINDDLIDARKQCLQFFNIYGFANIVSVYYASTIVSKSIYYIFRYFKRIINP